MRLNSEECRSRFERARVARLATVGSDGAPHLVPVTFALLGDEIVFAVDAKPKSTTALRRLDNIRHEPRVSFLVDEYAEDWSHLWWVRADGRARIVEPIDDGWRLAIDVLQERYEQYHATPPTGAVVITTVDRWVGWSA